MSAGTAIAQARKRKAGSTERGSLTLAMRCVFDLSPSRADWSWASAAGRSGVGFCASAGGKAAAPARTRTDARRLSFTKSFWHKLSIGAGALELRPEHEFYPPRGPRAHRAGVDDA